MKASNDKGFALIMVLWLIAVMGTLTILFTNQTRMSLKINRNSIEIQKAAFLAEAGIHRMIAELMDEELLSTSDNETEAWFNSVETFQDVPMGEGVYRLYHTANTEEGGTNYGAVDECGKLNINIATKEMLMQLPNATEDAVDSLIDWRDEDSNPGAMGGEDEYYSTLPEPYRAKNSQFDTIDELLIVKSMTLALLYGEDTNLNGTLDVNENDGEETYPIDNSDGVLDRGWYPYITCFSYEKNVDNTGQARININSAGEDQLREQFQDILTDRDIQRIIQQRQQQQFQTVAHVLDANIDREKWQEIVDKIKTQDDEKLWGRININTVPQAVLKCLLPQQEELVQDIIDFRQSSDGPFDNIGKLMNVPGINNNIMKQLAPLVCTKSSVFSMRAVGFMQRSNAYKEIFAIVDRGGSSPQIRYWKVVR